MWSRPPTPALAPSTSEAPPPRYTSSEPEDPARRPSGMLREGETAEEGAPASGRILVEAGDEMAKRLDRLARARGEPLENVAADLLRRGLEQETRRRQAEAGLAGLTPRQRQVARLAAGGRTNRQIAHELWLSPETIKTHLRRALEHFNVHSKAELRLLLFDLESEWPSSAPPGRQGLSNSSSAAPSNPAFARTTPG